MVFRDKHAVKILLDCDYWVDIVKQFETLMLVFERRAGIPIFDAVGNPVLCPDLIVVCHSTCGQSTDLSGVPIAVAATAASADCAAALQEDTWFGKG